MDTKLIRLEVNISILEGKEMPEEQDIVDAIIDRLYDFEIANSAILDTVLITDIDGLPTNEDELNG